MYRTGLFMCWHGGRPPSERRPSVVDDFRVMVHIFVAVLIIGTLWRLSSYHFIASKQPHLNHLGQAMATQY
jgi:hypothetical protein